MTVQDEEAKLAPAGPVTADPVPGANAILEKETAAPTETSEKQVDTATQDLNALSLDNKKDDAAPSKELNVPNSTETSTGPVWPETSADHPLTKFYASFEELTSKAEHAEVYGITLSTTNPFHTKLILQKFLRANANDLEKAKQQLLETLQWRKSFNPVRAISETFDKSRFGGLGYVLEVEGVPESANKKDVVTFNIYGAVKDKKATFGDLEGFLRWRVGLMEKSVQKLNLKDATQPIPDFGEGPDPYQGYQIHDYLQVSFLRQDPNVKAATAETIKVLGRYYPETLSRKFFVNVPVVMGWVYTAVKMVVAKETAKKFTVLSYGNQLATELGPSIPVVYGGKTGDLEEIAEKMTLT